MSSDQTWLEARRHKDRGESFPLSPEELQTNILEAVGIGEEEANKAFQEMFRTAHGMLKATKEDVHVIDGDLQKIILKDNPSRLSAAKLIFSILQAAKAPKTGRQGGHTQQVVVNLPDYYPKDKDAHTIDIKTGATDDTPDSPSAP